MPQIKITGELVEQFELYEISTDQEVSLDDVIRFLVDAVPELKPRLIRNEKLAPHLVVIYRGKPVRQKDFVTSLIQPDDTVEIMPIAGGG